MQVPGATPPTAVVLSRVKFTATLPKIFCSQFFIHNTGGPRWRLTTSTSVVVGERLVTQMPTFSPNVSGRRPRWAAIYPCSRSERVTVRLSCCAASMVARQAGSKGALNTCLTPLPFIKETVRGVEHPVSPSITAKPHIEIISFIKISAIV